MRITTSLGLLGAAASIALAAPAHAACGDVSMMKSSAWGGDDHSLLRADYEGNESIVGMWNVQFIAGGNQIDFGYQQWHSDGTEFMNSGGRPPSSQNFCMGVWQRYAPNHYRLNHWALAYGPNDTSATNRVNIREDVTVTGGGQVYSGSFTIDVYGLQGSTILQHVAGQVSGKRMTINTGP